MDKVQLENEVIEKFNVIHHSAIRLYLAMKLLGIKEEKEDFTKEEIASAAGISEKSVQRYIADLIKHSFVVNVPGNTRRGIKKSYKINKNNQSIDEFTTLNRTLVECMIRELMPSEIVVYTYMMFKINTKDKEFTCTSQMKIALDVGLTRSRISEVTDLLRDKKYIRKETVIGKQNRKKTTYTLRL